MRLGGLWGAAVADVETEVEKQQVTVFDNVNRHGAELQMEAGYRTLKDGCDIVDPAHYNCVVRDGRRN